MPRDNFSWQVGLAYADGAPKYLDLAEGENGYMWEESLVPALVAQQNTGGLSRSALPADLTTYLAFEDWSGGAGVVSAAPGDAAPTTYSYSRGVDASWGDRLYLSPFKTTLSGITGTVLKFYTSATYGEYAITARYVYQFSGGSWVERYDAGSDILTDIMEFENTVAAYLILARGASNDIVYGVNGTTFPSTSAGNRAEFLAVRGHTALEPNWLGVTAKGAIASGTVIGTLTAADQAGSRGETVNSVQVVDNKLVLLKDDGVYTFDGTDVAEKLTANALYRTTNGRASVIWAGNGFVYFAFDNRLVEYDPVADSFRTVYFPQHPELNGQITAITGTSTHIYFALTNRLGEVYVMKGNPNTGVWHSLEHLSTNPIRAMHVVRSGAIHSTNDVLVFDGASTTGYFILAQDGLRPEDDTAYRFRTTEGTIYGSLTDGGIRTIVKRLNGVRSVAEEMSASNVGVVSYVIDGSGAAAVAALTVNEAGLLEERITADVPFTRIGYVLTLNNSGSEISPRVLSVVFDATPYPPRRRRFSFVAALEWRPGPATGIKRRDAFTVLRQHLFGGLAYPVTLLTPFRETFIGKLQDVASMGYKVKTASGQGAETVTGLYRVVFEEITETTEQAATAIWDSSEWNDTRAWDD